MQRETCSCSGGVHFAWRKWQHKNPLLPFRLLHSPVLTTLQIPPKATVITKDELARMRQRAIITSLADEEAERLAREKDLEVQHDGYCMPHASKLCGAETCPCVRYYTLKLYFFCHFQSISGNQFISCGNPMSTKPVHTYYRGWSFGRTGSTYRRCNAIPWLMTATLRKSKRRHAIESSACWRWRWKRKKKLSRATSR